MEVRHIAVGSGICGAALECSLGARVRQFALGDVELVGGTFGVAAALWPRLGHIGEGHGGLSNLGAWRGRSWRAVERAGQGAMSREGAVHLNTSRHVSGPLNMWLGHRACPVEAGQAVGTAALHGAGLDDGVGEGQGRCVPVVVPFGVLCEAHVCARGGGSV